MENKITVMLARQRQLADMFGELLIAFVYDWILCCFDSMDLGISERVLDHWITGSSDCSASVRTSSRPCPERAKRHAL